MAKIKLRQRALGRQYISPVKEIYSIKEIPRVCIVIPTYNEKENIRELIEKISDIERNNYWKGNYALIHILVVDDNSPDGTANVVKEIMKHNPKVHLLLRKEKNGLGAAYKAGMKYGLETLDPDIFFEMDADGQHNPEDIFRMIEEVKNGADFVIGSRYVDGGSVPEEWGFHRKVVSFLAGNTVRIGLGLGDVKDASGGFRAIKKDVIQKINFDELFGDGYGFQASFLEAAVHEGFNVKEIPIHFGERTDGESKMQFSDMMEGFLIIYRIRKRRILDGVKNKFGRMDDGKKES